MLDNKKTKSSIRGKSSSYKLHFRQTDFPFIFTDIVFSQKNYGKLDYIILQEQDQIAGYLSQKGQKQAYELGSLLLNNKYATEKLKELHGLLFELKKNSMQSELNNISSNDLLSRWNIIENLCNKVGNLYLYCEQPVQLALEEIIIKASKSEVNLIKVLHDQNYAKKLKFNKQQIEYLNRLKEFGELKYVIHNSLGSLFENMTNFMKNFAIKYDLSFNQALSLRSSELKKILLNKKILEKKVLSERIKGLVFLPYRKNDGIILTGENYYSWKNMLNPIDVMEVKGNTAFPGKVIGKVKIHLSLMNGADIPEGTVLISGMTNPQIVPFLKKVIAIVTDEGGLTCHAAIISRELKVPCIVGTKIATQVFKDGDMVEVDANRGIIKKIK